MQQRTLNEMEHFESGKWKPLRLTQRYKRRKEDNNKVKRRNQRGLPTTYCQELKIIQGLRGSKRKGIRIEWNNLQLSKGYHTNRINYRPKSKWYQSER